MAKQEIAPRTDVDEQQSAEVALINDAALLTMFAEMAVMIPADDGNATEDILKQILTAETWDDLDAPWEVSAIDDVINKPMRITSAKRLPSTFAGGLGVFLVIALVDIKTGETYIKTTGSVSVVAQVARAYALQCTDVIVEWKRAERPSKNGYFPQHLKVLSATSPHARAPRTASKEA